MICCTSIIQSFLSESITTIGYTGAKPTVTVAYLQPDGSFITTGVFTNIELTPTQVIIDHGGPASGFCKLITQ